ncbi:MAG: ATP-binding protein [Candidatus Obscuribacterales bacterium]
MSKNNFDKTYQNLLRVTSEIKGRMLSEKENVRRAEDINEDLSRLVEEMNVACEELQSQNEQLIISNEVVLDQRAAYKSLFDNSPTPYLTTDTAGVICSANKAASQLLLVDAPFLVGRPLSMFFTRSQRAQLFAILDSLARGSTTSKRWETEIRPRKQPAFPAIINVSVARDFENRVLWTVQDISHRKAMEKARRYDQLSDFVAALMHDLRVPVIGCEIVLRRLLTDPPKDEADLSSKLQVLHSTNLQLLDHINALIEVYELENQSGKESFERRHVKLVDVTKVVTETLSSLSPLMIDKSISTEVFIEPMTEVEIDEFDLKRLITCLLDNAIKHSPSQGVVSLSARARDWRLTIEIEDQGEGIPEEDVPSLFTRFWLGRSKKEPNTTGLGLFLCKQLVDLYKGEITCQSKVGIGTKFTVELPVRAELTNPIVLKDASV